jgi:hypothetical protein
LFSFHPFTISYLTEHKYSDYEFEWHCKFKSNETETEKDEFVTDRPWKAARAIISKGKSVGCARLKYLLSIDGKALSNTANADGPKYTREEDMSNRVMAVMAGVSSNMPLNLFDTAMFKQYLCRLDRKHRSPYRLERTWIIEVFMDGAMLEHSRIITNHCKALDEGFVSASTDFWTDSYRKEQFGALVINMIAEKYFVDELDMWLFMSHETAECLETKGVRLFCSSRELISTKLP